MDVEVLRAPGENSTFKVTSNKYKTTFFVRVDPSDTHARYVITTSEGALSNALSGRFTDPLRALNTLKSFLVTAKESRAVKKEDKLVPADGQNGQDRSK